MNITKTGLLHPCIYLIILCTFGINTFGQSVGISSTSITPDASSIMELRSSTKGLLIPRMTTTQRNAISSPAAGLMIFNTTTQKFNFYDTTTTASWKVMFSGTGGVNSVSGTTNRITISGTASDPVADISSSYVGQNTITTLGTVTTGTWNGTTIATANGGTGGTTSPVAGGVIYGASTSAYGTTAAGSSGQILRSAGAGTPTWSTATYPAAAGNAGGILISDGTNFTSTAMTSATNKLAADVQMSATTTTFSDGPSVSLAAGTWFITGTITCATSTINTMMQVTAKLWDGTTVYTSSEYSGAKGGGSLITDCSITLSAVVTLASTTTIKISAADASGLRAIIKSSTVDNSQGANASFINAIRIGN